MRRNVERARRRNAERRIQNATAGAKAVHVAQSAGDDRRGNPLVNLLKRGSISEAQFVAGQGYADLFHASRAVAIARYDRSGGSSQASPEATMTRNLACASARAAHEAQRGALGPLVTIADHVCIHGMTVASWAEKRGRTKHQAMGALLEALDALVDVSDAVVKLDRVVAGS